MTSYHITSPTSPENSIPDIDIELDFGMRNPASDSNYLRIVKSIEEPDTGIRILYALIMANLRRVTFTYRRGAPPEAIAQFEEWFKWCEQFLFIQEGGIILSVTEDTEIIKASYKLFNRRVCNPIQEHLGAAYNKAQVLFPASPLLQKDSYLTAEQKQSADFLASVSRL